MKKDFILKVYEQMKNNPNLAGSYKLENESGIEWKLFEPFTIHIEQDYFGIDGSTTPLSCSIRTMPM